VHADYRQHQAGDAELGYQGLSEDLTVIEGGYLDAVAEVGTFEHSLTTDLLNHLVFVQKVFMKVCCAMTSLFNVHLCFAGGE
jgi:hypothetical protein